MAVIDIEVIKLGVLSANAARTSRDMNAAFPGRQQLRL